jgi:hypothetical protein
LTRYYTTIDSPTKRCPKCELWKPREEFYNHKGNTSGLSSRCKECIKTLSTEPHNRILVKRWVENNKQHIRERAKKYYWKARNAFLDMYGNKCSCCGEVEPIFLSLDHVKGQKGLKRKELSGDAYVKASKVFNPEKYRILCHNCNQATRYHEVCPHQRSIT